MDHGELSALRQAEHEQRILAEARGRKLESLEAQLKDLLVKVKQLEHCLKTIEKGLF